MQVEIVDTGVKGIVVVLKDERGVPSVWHLRMATPRMEDALPDHPFVWYEMTDQGWASICNKYGPEAEAEIEAAYQEQI